MRYTKVISTAATLLFAVALTGCGDSTLNFHKPAGPESGSSSLGTQLSCGPSQGGLFGMNVDPANPAGRPSPNDLKQAGARWVRMEFKRQYNYGGGFPGGFAGYDGPISNYRNAGIKVLLIIDYSSLTQARPALNAGDAEWNGYIDHMASRAATIAGHYGDNVDAYQIWNEPDLPDAAGPPGYHTEVPPRHFGTMLNRVGAAIKQHSSRPVITGGLATGNTNYMREVVANPAALDNVDALGVHNYSTSATGFSGFFNGYLQFGKPIWVTEVNGLASPDPHGFMERVHRTAQSFNGRVEHIFWFGWSDGMKPGHGILDAGGGAKSVYDTYRDMTPAWGNCALDGGPGPTGAPPSSAGNTSGNTSSGTSGGSTGGTSGGSTGGTSGGSTGGSTSGSCDCRTDVDNYCNYGVAVAGCGMTQPGGYCDPNGDGSFGDADWTRGYEEYQADCGSTSTGGSSGGTSGGTSGGSSGGSTSGSACGCRSDVDNFCNYGVDVADCPMTQPGGYCDPNGDGSFDDADWVRGYNEYHDQC